MHKGPEPVQIDEFAASGGLVGVVIPMCKHPSGVMQCVRYATLSSTVRAEEQRDRLQVKNDPCPDTLEVLNLYSSDHKVILASVPVLYGVSVTSSRAESLAFSR